ncbi:MAG: type II secretion system F family protein [Planctomycetes bacterium]|nr:type II secretion system F family protein [Planctomycetota bacterium]
MNLPLATALRFASRGRRGDEGRALRKMSNLLTLSASLSEALRQSAPCPPSVGSLITAGERSGQLSRALRLAEGLLDEQIERAQTFSLRAYCAYPAAVLFSGFLIVGGIMYNVMPKFQDIFLDFDTPLPESTRVLIGLSNWFILGFPPGWFWLACAALIGAVILLIRTLWPVGRIIRFLERVGDRVRWSLPFTRQIDWGQGMATACGVLEMGLTGGLPLDRAARLASDLRINHYVRVRLEEFTALVLGGASAVQAAREAKLGAMCVAALAAISRGEDPHTVLGHAADCYRQVANQWWHATAKLLWPLGTLVLGAMVGFVAWALFEPLVALIESVMDGI